jgi:hypothetical protein
MIFFCYVNEKDYFLNQESPKVDMGKLNQSYVFDENKNKIEEFYSVQEEQIKEFFYNMSAENTNKIIDTSNNYSGTENNKNNE